jgi:hypothetical protein
VIYRVPHAVIERTFAFFRRCGAGRRECQTLWMSTWKAPGLITAVVHPLHRSHAGGFALDDEWLSSFWLRLSEAGEGIRVQIHTHPADAFHSPTDDSYPIIHTPGFLSLVVPNFGLGPIGFTDSYLAEIGPNGRWNQVDVATRLRVVQ